MKTYYEILQVSKEADSDIIEKVYRLLIKKYHPDVSNSDPQKISEINNAYEVLSNPQKRKEYDIYLLNLDTEKKINEISSYEYKENAQRNNNNSYISYNIDILKNLIIKILSITLCCVFIMLVIWIATGYNAFKIFFK